MTVCVSWQVGSRQSCLVFKKEVADLQEGERKREDAVEEARGELIRCAAGTQHEARSRPECTRKQVHTFQPGHKGNQFIASTTHTKVQLGCREYQTEAACFSSAEHNLTSSATIK